MIDQVAALALIGAAVLVIGFSLGVSGLGGFLVPALLVAILGMEPTTAVFHGLVSFLIPGVIGAWMYWRKDQRPSWRIAILLCVGTLPGLIVGRQISLAASPTVLQLILAAIVVGSAVLLLAQGRRRDRESVQPPARVAVPAAGSAGFLGGISTVLAGVGGPLVTVPVLAACGMALTPVIGAALLNSVFGVAMGVVLLAGTVQLQPTVLVVITAAQLIGVPIGARWQDRLDNRKLAIGIAVAAILTAGWLVLRLLG